MAEKKPVGFQTWATDAQEQFAVTQKELGAAEVRWKSIADTAHASFQSAKALADKPETTPDLGMQLIQVAQHALTQQMVALATSEMSDLRAETSKLAHEVAALKKAIGK